MMIKSLIAQSERNSMGVVSFYSTTGIAMRGLIYRFSVHNRRDLFSSMK